MVRRVPPAPTQCLGTVFSRAPGAGRALRSLPIGKGNQTAILPARLRRDWHRACSGAERRRGCCPRRYAMKHRDFLKSSSVRSLPAPALGGPKGARRHRPRPDLVIPDVSVEAVVLNLRQDLTEQLGMSGLLSPTACLPQPQRGAGDVRPGDRHRGGAHRGGGANGARAVRARGARHGSPPRDPASADVAGDCHPR